jgi:uncharacterized protein (DUF2267 family)
METHHFENYASEGNEFLNKVASELGAPEDKEHAFRVINAVFHALRDRITIQESMNMISQLPMVLKALYINGWDITKERKRYDTKHEFLKEIYNETRTAEIDFGSNPIEEAHAVFRVMRSCISEGEMQDVKSQLPQEIVELMEA